MKKILIFAILIALFTSMPIAGAEDLGVQVIGGSTFVVETISLDDLKLEQTYKIDGYAKITPLEWKFSDTFYQYEKDHAGDNVRDGGTSGKNAWSHDYNLGTSSSYYRWINIMKSNQNAEFILFELDIINLSKTDVDFSQQATVKAVYDNDYEFAGWVRMYNYDNDSKNGSNSLVRAALHPDDSEPVAMMYTAHMLFGVTLPNAVVEDKAPLRMEITLGGNDLTLHIRK